MCLEKQQGPAIQHRELYPISHDNLNGNKSKTEYVSSKSPGCVTETTVDTVKQIYFN